MPVGVQILHLTVVGPFVRHIECRGYRAAVRIAPMRTEDFLVNVLIYVVNRIVKGQQHDLRCLGAGQITFWLCVVRSFVA